MEPQKALHLHIEEDKKKPKFIGHEYVIFEKYDGWYGYLDLKEGIVRSRVGREIPSCKLLSEKIMDSTHRRHGIAIFEILLHDITEFSELNGILNRSKGNCVREDAYAMIHDLVTDPAMKYRYRHGHMLTTFDKDLPDVQITRYRDVSSLPHVWKRHAEEVWATGGEGVILKRVEAPYSMGKRNADLMKIKEEVTLDLLVVDLEEGQGKYAESLGALVCKDKTGRVHRVSGMTDEQRDKMVENTYVD